MRERVSPKAILIIALILGFFLSFSQPAIAEDAFAKIITSIGSNETTLTLSRQNDITADLVIPSNIALRFNRGGSLNIATTKTVTINGHVEAGLYQIFKCTGTGKVVFGVGAVKEVYPQWWGAKGDGVMDDTAAIQAAIDSLSNGGLVCFAQSTYAYKGLILKPGVHLSGTGWHRDNSGTPLGTVLKNIGTSEEHAITFDYDPIRPMGTIIKDLAITGNPLSGHGVYIYGDEGAGKPGGTELTFSNCLINRHGLDGVHTKYSWLIWFKDCHIIENYDNGICLEAQSNAISFIDCHVTANVHRGLIANAQLGSIRIIGGAFEHNGQGGASYEEIYLGGGVASVTIQTYLENLTSTNLVFIEGKSYGISIDKSCFNFTSGQNAIRAVGSAANYVSGLSIDGNTFYGVAGGTAVYLESYIKGAMLASNSYLGTIDNRLLVGTTEVHYIGHDSEYESSLMLWNISLKTNLEGSLVWNPANLDDGVGETSGDITVTGAALGDRVEVYPPYSLQGILCQGYISAADTVNIRLQNETGGAIDLAEGTWKVKVIKP